MEDKKKVLIIINNDDNDNLHNNTYAIKSILKMNNDNSDLVTVSTTDLIEFATKDFTYRIITSDEQCEKIKKVNRLFIDYTMDRNYVYSMFSWLTIYGAIIEIKKSENVKYFNPKTMQIVDKDVVDFYYEKEIKLNSKINELEYKLKLINDALKL